MESERGPAIHNFYSELANEFVRIREVDSSSIFSAFDFSGSNGDHRSGLIRYMDHIANCCVGREEIKRVYKGLLSSHQNKIAEELYKFCVRANPDFNLSSLHVVQYPAIEGGDELASSGNPSRFSNLSALEDSLKSKIVGQEEAISDTIYDLKCYRAGLSGLSSGPILSRINAGRSSVGKSALVKLIASELDMPLVRIDCGSYTQRHEVARLIGSPPGYKDHEDGGHLTGALQENPDSVVLFDEVEKGDEDLHKLMLSILDDGSLLDGKGNPTDFSRSLLYATTNLGVQELIASQSCIGFSSSPTTDHRSLVEASVRSSLKKHFSPEFIARWGGISVFNSLNDDSAARIISLRLKDLRARLGTHHRMKFHWSDSAVQELLSSANYREFGARELERVVKSKVSDALLLPMFEDGGSLPRSISVKYSNNHGLYLVQKP